MTAKVVIMVGASGSGKSHYVREHYPEAHVFSADNFFIDDTGAYHFDRSRLPEAHQECMWQFIEAIHNHVLRDQVFVIDNTNLTVEYISPYIAVARAHGAWVEVVWMSETRAHVCHARGTHGTPLAAVYKQLQRQDHLRRCWPIHWPHPIVRPRRHENGAT